MPAFYIPHGAGPCFFMDWNPVDTWDKTADFLRSIPGSLPTAPKAIALVTAHWLAPQVTLSGAARPGMLFDYYGFPPHTYELRYPAPGAPGLAERMRTGHVLASVRRKKEHISRGRTLSLERMFARKRRFDALVAARIAEIKRIHLEDYGRSF